MKILSRSQTLKRDLFKSFVVSTLVFCPFSAAANERIVELVLEKHKFNIEVIELKVGEKITVKVTNKDKNFEEFESKSLNIEKFLKPGATATVYIGPLQAGEYDYFAEFYSSTGKGKIVVKP